jgi:hypothetical protein
VILVVKQKQGAYPIGLRAEARPGRVGADESSAFEETEASYGGLFGRRSGVAWA